MILGILARHKENAIGRRSTLGVLLTQGTTNATLQPSAARTLHNHHAELSCPKKCGRDEEATQWQWQCHDAVYLPTTQHTPPLAHGCGQALIATLEFMKESYVDDVDDLMQVQAKNLPYSKNMSQVAGISNPR